MSQPSLVRGVTEPALLEHTIGDALLRAARTWPAQEALVSVHQGIRWTYQQFSDAVDRLAAGFLAHGFTMCFPGGARFSALSELVAWGRTRYQQVAKRFERFDECWTPDGTVVYCHGTLEGLWLDGRAFEGIRFIDRFVVRDGLLQQQDVWNDLAEHRAT
jgi:non-ribosomal peptide synthetase component F